MNQKKWIPLLTGLTSLGTLFLTGCPPTQSNLRDILHVDARFFYDDAVTPLPNVGFTDYKVNFQTEGGYNIIRTLDSFPTGRTGVWTDSLGKILFASNDLALSYVVSYTDYVSSCARYSYACQYDYYYNNYYCNNYCVSYTSYPVDRSYTQTANFHNVSSAQAWVEYELGSSQITTLGTNVQSGQVNTTLDPQTNLYTRSEWQQTDNFVIPVHASGPAAGQNPAQQQSGQLVLSASDQSRLNQLQENQLVGDAARAQWRNQVAGQSIHLIGAEVRPQFVEFNTLTDQEKETVRTSVRRFFPGADTSRL